MSNQPSSSRDATLTQGSLTVRRDSNPSGVDARMGYNNPGTQQETLSKTVVPSPFNYGGFGMMTSPYPASQPGHDSRMTPSMFFKEMNKYSAENMAHEGNVTRSQCAHTETPSDEKDGGRSKATVLTVSASSRDLQGEDHIKAAAHPESFSINKKAQMSSRSHQNLTACDPSIVDVPEDDVSPAKTGELPRRLLNFEASTDEKVHGPIPDTSKVSNPQGYRTTSVETVDMPLKTLNMMTPLDGRHHTQLKQHVPDQSYPSMGPPSERQIDQQEYQEYQKSYHENDSSKLMHKHASPLFDHININSNTPNFDGRYSGVEDFGSAPPFEPSPSLDRFHMPIIDIHSGLRSDSKQFEDYLMGSPALNWSITKSGGKTVGGSGPRDSRANRRVTYDLHDDPAFNENQNSPITAPRGNSSAARYYTPIITSGNDRQPVHLHSNDTNLSYHSDKNYRPSPPGDSLYDDYEHLRHYHRTFPTMRGQHSSPLGYDASYQPPAGAAREPLETLMYATPVMPRGGPFQQSYSAVGGDRRGLLLMTQGQTFGLHHGGAPQPVPRHLNHMGGYYGGRPHAPNIYTPHNFHPSAYISQDPRYPPPPQHQMPHIGKNQYSGNRPQYPRYPSPYQYMPQTVDNSSKKKRKMNNATTKPLKNQKRKKMYSDFVGVTYNKTHAKFQACITHYRKQHYLGRYKLACDAARAYDQSAKMLKGDSWKINFQSEEEYLAARERELSELEDKRNMTNSEVENLRESFVTKFPSEAALRERLGIDGKSSNDVDEPTGEVSRTQSQGKENSQTNTESKAHNSHLPTPASASNTTLPGRGELSDSGDKKNNITAPGTTIPNQSVTKSAVTPSPNVFSNLTKNSSTLMTEPLMSPAFKIGSSPSAHSLLGGTPFSMPGSSIKFNSITKSQSSENVNRDFGPVSSNIFQSPFMKDFSHSTKSATKLNRDRNDSMSNIEEGDDSDDKGKGDLTAASAFLMMNGN
mmetsp:Transcript_17108/g.32369  ORF Transcript_17108/g.32369 Transcript_17108/m.32369 type:complete len:976 (-) Transcript_17108:71-2998(-)